MTDSNSTQLNKIINKGDYQANNTNESQFQLNLNQIPKTITIKEPVKKDYCGFVFSFGMLGFSLGAICWNLYVLKAIKGSMAPFLWGSFYSGVVQFFVGLLQYIRGDNSIIFFVFGMIGLMNVFMEYCRVNGWFPQPSMVELGWHNLFAFFSILALTLGGWNSIYLGINLTVSLTGCLINAIANFCESNAGLKVGAAFGIVAGAMGYYTAVSTLMQDSYGEKSILPVF